MSSYIFVWFLYMANGSEDFQQLGPYYDVDSCTRVQQLKVIYRNSQCVEVKYPTILIEKVSK